MEDFKQEHYLIWNKGVFHGLIYSVSYSGTMSKYTFYTDFRVGKKGYKAGEYQLAADLKVLTNKPISDQEIADAFAKSLSKKINIDIKTDSKEYVECMKTLPKGFFTERNVEAVLENVVREHLHADHETIIKSDTACCDLMEYAHSQNHNVHKGTGRNFLGE